MIVLNLREVSTEICSRGLERIGTIVETENWNF